MFEKLLAISHEPEVFAGRQFGDGWRDENLKTLCQKIFGMAVSHFANLDLFRPSITQQSLNFDRYESLENLYPQTRYVYEPVNSNQHLSMYNLVSGSVRHVTCLQADNARCCIMEISVPETFGIIDMLSLSLRSQPRTDSVLHRSLWAVLGH